MLLAIALLPVFLVASLFFFNSWSSLKAKELDHVAAIASIHKHEVESLISQNQARLTGYTSRTGLRTTVDQFNHQQGTAAAATRALLQTSVTNLMSGDPGLQSVTLLNPDGIVVASTDTNTIGQPYSRADYVSSGRTHTDVTSYLERHADGSMSLYLVGPLPQGSNLAGVAVLETNFHNFSTVTSDYTGLGDTGEVMLVRRDPQGNAQSLLPLRSSPNAALSLKVNRLAMRNPAILALYQQEGAYDGLTDFRGHKVLAATRYIPAAGWGLAVMIDQSEAYQPLEQLTDLLIIGMFIISVMIIFVAFALARYLTDPILALAVAADRVRDGDLSARAPIGGGDETGRLAATFNSMVENVEKVDQMKSEFVLLASHQLRTPATAVKGFISMLLDGYSGKVDPKQRELMEAAYEENERQISVINSILDVARLEAGEMMLQRGLHDVGQVAAASAAALAPVAKSQHQTITVKRPRRPATILVDAEKLQLVLDNLIHNATKYSGPGTHISVEVKNHPHAVTVAVKDQGIGIDPADQARLFKRFSRIAGPQTANIQGAGLGLYLAGRLVKMHGGRIFVKSAEGKGTTFTVELPNITREDDPRGKNIDS